MKERRSFGSLLHRTSTLPFSEAARTLRGAPGESAGSCTTPLGLLTEREDHQAYDAAKEDQAAYSAKEDESVSGRNGGLG